MKLSDYSVLTFDCYGTLIDWEGGIWQGLQSLLEANPHARVSRDSALRQFAVFETAQQQATPAMLYPDVLTLVHAKLATHFSLQTNTALNEAFGQSVAFWPAFGDSAEALQQLQSHYKLVVLSNVHRQGFAASNKHLKIEFDAVYTAEDVGSYKPASANFDFMIERLASDFGIGRQHVLHTAQSLHHDHLPAHRAGLDRCWIDRQSLKFGGSTGATAKIDEQLPEPHFYFNTMADMAQARQHG